MSAESAHRYAIGVGSNLGDRAGTIAHAARLLVADGMVRVVAVSALHETAPVGGPQQPAFLNAAWVVATALGPHQLLYRLQAVESACGRTRTVHWGPRTLDLDLLLRADGLALATPALVLPHPRLAERAFVLRPLTEIAADWPVPGLGTVATLAAACACA